MPRITGRAFATLAALAWALACACNPTYDVDQQYMDETTNPEVGLKPFNFGTAANYATFAPGQMLPTTTNAATMIWTSGTTFLSTIAGGGGAVPVSITGTAVDSDADLVADELDVTLAYDTPATETRTLLRTDPIADYRCFGGAGSCEPALAPPECVWSPLGGTVYDVTVTIPFADGDGDLNPNPNHNLAFVYCRDGGFGSSCTPFAIPETITTWVLTASGTTTGTLNLSVPGFDLIQGIDTIHSFSFQAWDVAGHESQKVSCAAPAAAG